jgi:predicted ArsR family transcriptional regulator
MKDDKLTPTEQRIIDMLSDGIGHTVDEIKNCLYDVIGAESVTVRMHLSNINKKILPRYEVVCIKNKGRPAKGLQAIYRLMRTINMGE